MRWVARFYQVKGRMVSQDHQINFRGSDYFPISQHKFNWPIPACRPQPVHFGLFSFVSSVGPAHYSSFEQRGPTWIKFLIRILIDGHLTKVPRGVLPYRHSIKCIKLIKFEGSYVLFFFKYWRSALKLGNQRTTKNPVMGNGALKCFTQLPILKWEKRNIVYIIYDFVPKKENQFFAGS